MARLEGREELMLDVRPRGRRHEWMEYEILFLWRGEPILNEGVFKRGDEFHDTKEQGALMANQHLKADGGYEKGLVEVIKETLETDEPVVWEPLEPDASIAFCPAEYTTRCFAVTAFFDANAFKGCGHYTCDGVSLAMTVTRESLVEFCKQLKEETEQLALKE